MAMRTSTRSRSFGFLLCTLLAAVLAAPALGQRNQRIQRLQPQDVIATARFENPEITLGETAILVIRVDGTTEAFVPELPRMDDLRTRLFRRAIMTPRLDIRRGRQVRVNEQSVQWSFRVEPQRTGVFVIPPIEVEVARGEFRQTEPLTLIVDEPARLPGYTLEVVPDDDDGEWYVGQPVRLSWIWTLNLEQGSPITVSMMGRLPNDGVLVRVPLDDWLGANRTDQPIGFLGQLAEVAIRSVDGQLQFVIERMVVVERTGEFRIGPFAMLYRTALARNQQYRSDAAPWSVRVVPQPTEGKPASFTGFATGQDFDGVRVASRATPTDVAVGDPIQLELRIGVDMFGELLVPPDLAAMPGFKDAFRVSPSGWTLLEATPTGRTWQTTIRPTLDTATEIPPIEFATLDAVTGTYRLHSTEPIPLQVEPAPEITADDAIGGMGVFRAVPLGDGPGGLRANYSADEVLNDRVSDPLAEFPLAGWVVVLASGPGLLAIAGAIAWARHPTQVERRRQARALASARRALGQDTSDLAAVSRAIRSYVGDRLGLDGQALTSVECHRELAERGIDEESLGQLDRTLDAYDAGTFGGDQRNSVTLDEVRGLLGTIDSALRKAKA